MAVASVAINTIIPSRAHLVAKYSANPACQQLDPGKGEKASEEGGYRSLGAQIHRCHGFGGEHQRIGHVAKGGNENTAKDDNKTNPERGGGRYTQRNGRDPGDDGFRVGQVNEETGKPHPRAGSFGDSGVQCARV